MLNTLVTIGLTILCFVIIVLLYDLWDKINRD